jgi:hypothetical protein
MDTQQAIVEVTDRPKVGDLILEFKRNGSQGDQFGRMLRAEDVRLARWDGQSEDGKKHAKDQPDGDEVFPWEGASDVRNYLADGAVNESVALCYMAFWNAVLKISGATMNDLPAASAATEFLDWMIHFQLLKQLDNEVELSAQYMQAIGATGLHVSWEREVGRKLQPVKMEEILALGQQVTAQVIAAVQASGAPGGAGGPPHPGPLPQGGEGGVPPELLQLQQVLEVLPQLITDPTMEGEAVKAIQYLYGEFVHKNLPADIQESEVLLLSDKRARQCVKDLRRDGKCDFPMPYLSKNQPKIAALKPYRDFVLPVEVGAIETAPVVFVRDLMTEVQLRSMVLGAGWDPDWVEEAVKTKGKFSTWQLNNPYSAYGTWSWRAVDNRSWLIEVVHAYYKQIDEDGVTQVTVTTFSPHLTRNPKGPEGGGPRSVVDAEGKTILDDFAAKHAILNYPRAEYPVILGRRERFDRSWLATRGLAEILATDQNVEKAMDDSVVDNASIGTVPPLLVPKGLTAKYKLGPAVQNEYVPGREPKFMDMPENIAPAEMVVARIRQKVNRYCGLFDATLPPALTALLQQPMVKKFLIMWGEALQMAYELTAKFAPDKIEQITGSAPSEDVDDFHYVMQFDAAQFHPELMEKKLAAFDQLAAQDRTGTIDQAGLTKVKAMMIDPGMAKQLVVDQGQASIKLQKDVQNDFAQMFLGNEAIYDDASNDPAAQMKLQYAGQILQRNPNYLQSLDPQMAQEFLGPQAAQQIAMIQAQSGARVNPRFTELVENYLKNLKQGAVQQQNKLVGRTGVKQLT